VQLRDLGRKQSELISIGEMTSLLRLLSAKNQVIVAIQAIEQELNPYHAQNPEQRDWQSAQARADCAELAEKCRQLLAEVMLLERENEQQMTVRRDEVAGQLQAAQAASNARGAYQAQQMITPRGSHLRKQDDHDPTNVSQRLDLLSGT
jgi:hypothetical protein